MFLWCEYWNKKGAKLHSFVLVCQKYSFHFISFFPDDAFCARKIGFTVTVPWITSRIGLYFSPFSERWFPAWFLPLLPAMPRSKWWVPQIEQETLAKVYCTQRCQQIGWVERDRPRNKGWDIFPTRERGSLTRRVCVNKVGRSMPTRAGVSTICWPWASSTREGGGGQPRQDFTTGHNTSTNTDRQTYWLRIFWWAMKTNAWNQAKVFSIAGKGANCHAHTRNWTFNFGKHNHRDECDPHTRQIFPISTKVPHRVLTVSREHSQYGTLGKWNGWL